MLHAIALLALTLSPTPPLLTCVAEGMPLTLTVDAKMHLALQHGRERLFGGELVKVSREGATYAFSLANGESGLLHLDEGQTELEMGKDQDGLPQTLSCSPMTVRVDRLHLAALVEASRSSTPQRLASCSPDEAGSTPAELLVEPGLRPGTALIRGSKGHPDSAFVFVAHHREASGRIAGSGAYCNQAAGYHCLRAPSLRVTKVPGGSELHSYYEFAQCRLDPSGLARLRELLAEAP